MALKDMLGIETIVDQKIASMKSDLYKSIKEVAEMKYRLLEVETSLHNLTMAVKILTGKGGLSYGV